MPSEKGSEKPQEEDVTVPQVKDMKTRVRVVAFDRGRWGKLRIEGKASYKAEKWRQMKWEELRMLSGVGLEWLDVSFSGATLSSSDKAYIIQEALLA